MPLCDNETNDGETTVKRKWQKNKCIFSSSSNFQTLHSTKWTIVDSIVWRWCRREIVSKKFWRETVMKWSWAFFSETTSHAFVFCPRASFNSCIRSKQNKGKKNDRKIQKIIANKICLNSNSFSRCANQKIVLSINPSW